MQNQIFLQSVSYPLSDSLYNNIFSNDPVYSYLDGYSYLDMTCVTMTHTTMTHCSMVHVTMTHVSIPTTHFWAVTQV